MVARSLLALVTLAAVVCVAPAASSESYGEPSYNVPWHNDLINGGLINKVPAKAPSYGKEAAKKGESAKDDVYKAEGVDKNAANYAKESAEKRAASGFGIVNRRQGAVSSADADADFTVTPIGLIDFQINIGKTAAVASRRRNKVRAYNGDEGSGELLD